MKKGLKKVLLGIVLSVMTLGASLLAGCSFVSDLRDRVDQLFCEHETTKIVEAVAPTCTEDGYTRYKKCLDCGKELTKGVVIKATGHNVKETKSYAATCETDGEKTFVCVTCGNTTVEIIPATGHIFNSYPGVCIVCGGETTTISGTWYFNEILSLPETDIYATFNVGGCSTLEGDFSSIQCFDCESLHYYIDQYYEEFVLAYDFNSNTWAKEGYRTVVIHEEEIVEGKFYAWLIENAVKQ